MGLTRVSPRESGVICLIRSQQTNSVEFQLAAVWLSRTRIERFRDHWGTAAVADYERVTEFG